MTSFQVARQVFTPGPRDLQILLIEADARLAREAFAADSRMPRLHTIGDGAEALRYLRKQDPHENVPRPDLVMLDLSLPTLSGREVLRALKSDPDLQRIPIIVLTTSDSSREIADLYELHANCCVDKPEGLEAFIRFIQAAQHFWFQIVTLPAR
jgi:chemotaxis family two-component system response regulator Rcp1